MDNKYKHLKNLNIEELVGQDKEVKPDYDKALKTIKNVRTAFASSKAALLTFINDVSELEEKVHASMNTNELENIKSDSEIFLEQMEENRGGKFHT